MANTIRHKRGTTAPLAGDLVTGELAIDTATGTVYTKKDDNSVVAISGAGGGLADAPSDGDEYVRKDGAWAVATGGGGGGSYLPLAGGTMTGAIVFDGTSGQYISKGNFDTARGGNYGISLVCSIGYEFNWQAGWLTTTEQNSVTPRPLYLDSLAGTTLRVWDSSTSKGTEVSHENIVINSDATYDSEMAGWGFGVQQSDDNTKGTTVEFNGLNTYDGASYTQVTPTGITFTDATVQTTAAIADAPSDSTQYVRYNGSWVTVTPVGTFGDSPSDGNYYVRMGTTGWAQIGSGTDAIATQDYVTSQGYATTGDVSTAVSGLVSTANARRQAVVESARAVLNDSAYGFDGSMYYYTSFMSGAFNFTVTNSQFSSGGKWFGFKHSSTIYSASGIALSSGVVTITSSQITAPDAGTGLFYTEDGGTTWFESSIPVSA